MKHIVLIGQEDIEKLFDNNIIFTMKLIDDEPPEHFHRGQKQLPKFP